ncbi:BREX system ATP-binding protein BrxD, partial [Candidatus Gracilibacteria bacterium]|nr:BREX system ATP-binding protein BrxD [Candidatus Gracilibacteria bacterium]
MNTLTQKDVEHVFESLRKGLVPERGIDAFAVGIEKQRGELHRQLDLARAGEGTIKFLRGGYGCGKTFMARLALLDAQAQGFATSFVVVSDNDLRFHRFDDVYRKVLTELGTAACPRGAFGDILDRWIGKVEDKLVASGEDEEAPDFDDKVRRRLDEDLAA